MTRTDPVAALRESGFLLFLIGAMLSHAGNHMRAVAVGWEIFQRTRQPISLGLIGLALALPILVLAIPAGAAADRFSRRIIVLLAQAGMAVSGLGLAWASATRAPLPIVYLLLLTTGCFRAMGWPASTALVAGLVPPQVFPNAAMWRSMSIQLAATLGPLAAGILLAWWSPTVVYVVDAASSVVLMVCLFFVKPQQTMRSHPPQSWRDVGDGIRFLRRQPVILSTMTLDLFAVLFGGATALLPIYASEILHVGATGFGWLRAMPSIGAICMGLWMANRPLFERGGRTLLMAVSIYGLATIVFGLSTSFPLSLLALFVLGAADNVSVVIRATVLQLLTPDDMRGRVSAVSVIFIGSSNELGELESGVVAQWLGAVATVVAGGCLTLVTVFGVARIWPDLRQLGRLDQLKPAS